MGETHQLKPVVCVEILLRQMEHMVVVEKIPGFRSQPRERSSGQESLLNLTAAVKLPGDDMAPKKLPGASEKETRNTQQTRLGVYWWGGLYRPGKG